MRFCVDSDKEKRKVLEETLAYYRLLSGKIALF